MIASAFGAQVIAIDVSDAALKMASAVGATAVIDANCVQSVVDAVKDIANGGVHLSIDALGSSVTCHNSIANLRKRGRHVQVGLLAGADYRPSVAMELVIANELEIVGSHGMQAHAYGRMLQMILEGKLKPQDLVGQTVDLEQAAAALSDPAALQVGGVTVIDRF
jgi:alcohol dehydrogenase